MLAALQCLLEPDAQPSAPFDALALQRRYEPLVATTNVPDRSVGHRGGVNTQGRADTQAVCKATVRIAGIRHPNGRTDHCWCPDPLQQAADRLLPVWPAAALPWDRLGQEHAPNRVPDRNRPPGLKLESSKRVADGPPLAWAQVCPRGACSKARLCPSVLGICGSSRQSSSCLRSRLLALPLPQSLPRGGRRCE